MSDWRILALDLDGTVMGDGESISPAVVAALQAARARGVRVVLATGRADGLARKYAARLGLRDPIICYHGGMIVDGETGEVLYEAIMPSELAVAAIRWGRQRGRHLLLFADGKLWIDELRYPPSVYEHWMGLPLHEVDALDAALEACQVCRVLKVIDFLSDTEKDTPSVILEWREAFGGRLLAMRTHPLFIELTSPEVSKGHALAWLAARWGTPRAQVIAVGDAENDLSMIEWAGLGVAMGQAPAHIRAAADWVAPSVAEDGVAAVVARFILNGDSNVLRDELSA
jgi:Cof subfamily protein (haloacid dehalogenase superfamily)